MSFRDFREEVKGCLMGALAECGYSKVEFELTEPPRPDLGDLSSNLCFQIAREAGSQPSEVAEEIGGRLSIEAMGLISSFGVHPSGYINFRVNLPELAYRTLIAATSLPNYGAVDLGKGRRLVVEHTSVNPVHQLHVGHLRNVALGDSVCRILRFTGHDVKALNYVDDSGLQVADVVVGLKYANIPLDTASSKKFDHLCGEVYVKVNELYEARPELLMYRSRVVKEMEEGVPETASFSRELTKRVVEEQLKTCWRVGARYDCLNFESHILAMRLWQRVFQLLREKRLVELATVGKLSGCWIVKVEGEEEKVLVRSDGTSTYIAKDIPYAAWKLGLIQDPFPYEVFSWQPDGNPLWTTSDQDHSEQHPLFAGSEKAVNVIDVRQGRLQRIVAQILSKLAGTPMDDRYVHLGYEVVALSRGTAERLGMKLEDKEILHMSGRRGFYISADDVLDALYAKSLEECVKRNPSEAEGWLRSIAEKVAVAAIRFALLKQDVDKMIVFDLEEALNLEGETGPYIQYAHARASRILEKAGIEPTITKGSAPLLVEPSEADLVKLISKFDMYVEEAARNLSPKLVARYSYQLATSFNSFYERSPVLQVGAEGRRMARLALVRAFQNTIRIALSLLGIEAPERI